MRYFCTGGNFKSCLYHLPQKETASAGGNAKGNISDQIPLLGLRENGIFHSSLIS